MKPRNEVEKCLAEDGQKAPAPSRSMISSSHHCAELLSNTLYTQGTETVSAPAKAVLRDVAASSHEAPQSRKITLLYTPEERRRRDATKWTLVQGVLAPVQFAIFLVSLALVIRYLATGEGYVAATASVVLKTFALYAIMVTGAIWEKEVFGVYLFAPAFFWEDVFSFLVIALHTAYLVAVIFGLGDSREQMLIALAAYASYLINATQFILKLRAARRDETAMPASSLSQSGSRA